MFLILLQADPTQVIDTGFNWSDYGPIGIMCGGLVAAVVVLWRKNERLELESKQQAERVLTVLIEVNRILPDVLTTIRDTRQDREGHLPLLERIDVRIGDLEKSVKALVRAASANKRRGSG